MTTPATTQLEAAVNNVAASSTDSTSTQPSNANTEATQANASSSTNAADAKQEAAPTPTAQSELEKLFEKQLEKIKSELLATMRAEADSRREFEGIPAELHDSLREIKNEGARKKMIEALRVPQTSTSPQVQPARSQAPATLASPGAEQINFEKAIANPEDWKRAKEADPQGAKKFIERAMTGASLRPASHSLV